VSLVSKGERASVVGERKVFDPGVSETTDASVVLRDRLQTGSWVAGPAAITEDETTIIVPSSRSAIRQSDGCIDIMTKG